MTESPTVVAGTAELRSLIGVLRPEMEAMADDVLHQVLESVAHYSFPPGTTRHQRLATVAHAATRHFLDQAESLPGRADRVDDLLRRLGYDEAQTGRSLRSIETALWAAGRASWQHLAEISATHDLSGRDLRELADAIYDYLGHVRDQITEGFDLGQKVGAHKRYKARVRLFKMLLSDPTPGPGPDVPLGIDDDLLRGLAEAAEWPVPHDVVALAVSYHGEPPSLPMSPELLTHVQPHRALVLCPADDHKALVEQISRSLPGLRIAVSWAVSPREAGSTLRWCQRALDLVQLGVLTPTPVIRCVEHVTQLWLHAEPSMRQHLCQKLLQPLLAESPNSRAILSETLLTWVETRDSAPAIAARLDIHPQTVRYRWKRLNELFGNSLLDPEFILQMTLVLKASVPLWKAGDQSDFDLFRDRKESRP